MKRTPSALLSKQQIWLTRFVSSGTKILLLLLCALVEHNSWAQQKTSLRGVVRDKRTEAVIAGAAITIEKTQLGAISDSDGTFLITDIPVGSYNVRAQALGYENAVIFDVVVTTGNQQSLSFEMNPDKNLTLKEVVVKNNPYSHSAETPLSIQNLSAEEIKSNPGGNFDVSRVIQGFPGVGGTSGSVGGYRNDIIIRGGAPNENVYYLDGIEIPVLNHFATQGSAGGPTGILNTSFINSVDLFTSAFPAKYDNPLSGVLQLKEKDANPTRIENNIRLSATELAYSADGPISDNLTFQVSARRSYLQLLFQALQVPIQPSYWDFQYKINYKINKKLTFYTIGIGAIDNFSFLTPKNLTPENVYILHGYPLIKQWSYTNGYALKKLIDKGYWNLSFSRNMLNNELDKYLDNQNPSEATRTLKVHSAEAENKLRFDVNKFYDRYSYSYGAMVQYDEYTCDFFDKLRQPVYDSTGALLQPAVTLQSNSKLNFFKYGIYGQFSANFFNKRLNLSAGLRTDGNTFMNSGNDLTKQISPRLSASAKITDKILFNASAAEYYKIPTYTILGYQDSAGNFANRDAKYISCMHYVGGFEFLPALQGSRITIEAFDKQYKNYPISLIDNVSLANEGGDFNVLGDEPVASTGLGRSYGVEFQVQQKFIRNFFVILAYTLYKSEFTNGNGEWVPASWDNKSLLSFIGGYKFRKNWELGVKFRYQGGAPYTPFNVQASKENYLILGTGIPDYSKFNSLRLQAFNSMDMRIDKKWNLKKMSIDLFYDMTNVYGSIEPAAPTFTFARTADNKSFLTTDGKPLKADGSNGIPYIINNSSAVVIPSVGFIVEF